MATSQDVKEYLSKKMRSSDEATAKKWTQLDEFYSARRWHELTMELLDLVKQPQFNQGQLLIELYENFIREFEQRIKTISFVELCASIVKQYGRTEDALQFIDKCEKRVTTTIGQFKVDQLALAYCKVVRGDTLMKLEDKGKRNELMKDLLEEIDEILTQIDGITKVHGLFYHLQSQFYRETGDLTAYYKSALKYLGCTDAKTLPILEQQQHAKLLTISALVADDIYNFGELLSHPILNSIKGASEKWLVDLLVALNHGVVNDFEKLKSKWGTNPILAKNEDVLRTKAILLAIMEMTFRRTAWERQLSFTDIAKATNLRADQVELFVMKAISKGLVDGKIDESEKKVYMTWVQPRVLDKHQIGGMVTRLDKWHKDIIKAQGLVPEETAEMFAE